MQRDFESVQTGQDVIDLGIIPKTSSSHIALIAFKRLLALRNHTLETITDEMMGNWQPAIVRSEITDREITAPNEIMTYAKEGMRVQGITAYDGQNLQGIMGTIRTVVPGRNMIDVQWDQKLAKGHDLSKTVPHGYGYSVSPQAVKLMLSDGKGAMTYDLAPYAIADPNLGHKARFRESYTLSVQITEWQKVDVEILAGTQGRLFKFDRAAGTIDMHLDSPVTFNIDGKPKEYKALPFPFAEVADILEVSSLGQMAPAEKDVEVRKQVYSDLFPTTVLNTETAEQVTLALLMGKDMIFYGPAGAGKSNTAKDIVRMAGQMEVLFTVEGCQVQCNPFSLFDKEFAKEVDACPECKIKYDPDFITTGRFKRPQAKDVKVVVPAFSEGHGSEMPEGTVGMMRYHLAGHKLPQMNITGTLESTSDYDPKGYHAGMLARTNNGVLVLDEIELLRVDTRGGLREALNGNRIRPDDLRHSYPAHALVIGTANNPEVFEEPLIDRMLLLQIDYPDDVDTAYGITRKAFHGEVADVNDVAVGDTHREKSFDVEDIFMPSPIERAVESFFIKFRREYDGRGKTRIMGSGRCKPDMHRAARAKLMVDRIFYESTPSIAGEEYAVYGLKYALGGRVQQADPKNDREYREHLNTWVVENFSDLVKQEENTWWCRLYQTMAVRGTKIPEIESNFNKELEEYEKALQDEHPEVISKAFASIKKAYEAPDDRRFAMNRVTLPFMDYLFKDQPGMQRCGEEELLDLMKYFLKSRENTSCKV